MCWRLQKHGLLSILGPSSASYRRLQVETFICLRGILLIAVYSVPRTGPR